MRLCGLLTACAIGSTTPAWAITPKNFDVHGLDFVPTLEVQESYDDNFRALSEDVESSWITTLKPAFSLTAEDRNSAYRLSYQAVSEHYHSAADASNTDHDAKLESILAFDARQRLHLEAGYKRQEDTASTAVNRENDKYHSSRFSGRYDYGARTAINQLSLAVSQERLRYDNSGEINADKDRDTLALTGTWTHALGGSTRALLELRHSDFDYTLADSRRNSTNQALLAGATWEATARTTGKVRIGYEQKDFDDPRVDDLDSPMWEVGLDWAPRTYSVFTLNARRAFDEGDDGSDAVKTTSTELLWRHEWTSRLSSNLSFGLSRQVYEGQERDDDISSASLSLTYAVRRWLDISLGYRYRKNDSSVELESYERNIYLLSLTGSF
ncbi:outer membrane beta-barrel protein [Pseudomonas sp. GOM6]|uniref:surface lipoprotein assembly modifier n=1 Tax=Pseudomonas sp. GOM6 TaxID=3036944 RepID=UPI00240A04F9|nr:outer membrane beta-barrel protein [Pseudomonas sp. GOM6]MDG1579418.1 outer membrane beta-barrel protein [Pseudomonas sp. GOM6]